MYLIDLIQSINITDEQIVYAGNLLLFIISTIIANRKTKPWRSAETRAGKLALYILERISVAHSADKDKLFKLPLTDGTKHDDSKRTDP